MLICNAYKTQRVYFYTRREPDTELYTLTSRCIFLCSLSHLFSWVFNSHLSRRTCAAWMVLARDVFDEKPTREDRAMAMSGAGGAAAGAAAARLYRVVITLHHHDGRYWVGAAAGIIYGNVLLIAIVFGLLRCRVVR